MKRLLTFSFLLLTIGLFAQPANDDCPGIVHLGIAPSCDSTLYNNVGATESNIGFDNFPPCWTGNPVRDVWFAFEAADTILDYRIIVTGCPDPANGIDAMVNPQIAIYRGDCEFDGLQLLECATSSNGEGVLELDLVGLTPGLDYFIRINDWTPSGTPNNGAFKLCVIKKPPITTIDQGGSTLCAGALYDSGGPDEDYGNSENFTFTICPTQPHNCINFSMEYYNLESFGADVLTFYDGPNITSPQIGILDGFGSGDFANTGGVCYSVSASSGCMTIQFISSGTTTFEGFSGLWECTTDECQPTTPITVNTDATPTEIVESVVAGQTTVTITNINCPNGALGTFEAGANSDLGLEKGMVMTSGSAGNVANPASFFSSAFLGGGGDPDLDSLSFNYSTFPTASTDVCIVEMDVFAATDEITFEYIFGSEEYPGFVNTGFNDIFTFLASGPGIIGDPVVNGQLNVATLPDGTFIEINSVNDGLNWQYYRNNTDGMSVCYGGLTSDSLGVKKSLTAKIPTIPCNTYHLKFAIGDRGDTAFDSGVFISEIKGGSPVLAVDYNTGINYIVEGCTPIVDDIVISLNNQDFDQPVTYEIVVGGTAEMGVDYTLNIPPTVTFVNGDEVFTFPIAPITDGLTEGIETVEISLTQDFGCGSVVLATVKINIYDLLVVDILDDLPDTILVCGGSCEQLMAEGAADFFWQPPGLFSDPSTSNPTICPDSSLWVQVTGTLGICSDVDSVFLNVITPVLDVLPSPNVTICAGDTAILTAVNNVNNSNLQWQTFFIPLNDPTNPTQVIVPPPFFNQIFLTVSVELGGCIETEQVIVTVDPFDFPQVANDTTICQNFSVDLGEDIFNTVTAFQWTPDLWLTPNNLLSGPLATPEVTTTYQLIGTSPTGICTDTAEVTITVIPADIEISNPDTTYICVGDTVTLNSSNSTNGVGVSWTPTDFMTINSPTQVLVYPPVTTWYYNILDATADCTVLDSVLVWVDSLPDLNIMAIPEKDSYCEGDEVVLVSPTYEPSNFPAIDFTWLDPMPGAQTPDSFLNMVILTVETNTYYRVTTVNACVSTDSIMITVVPASTMTVEPATSTVCQGQPVQLNVVAPPEITEFTWTPPNGLSCTDCPDPMASPGATTTYTVEGEFMGCLVAASATVTVPNTLVIPNDQFICPGDDVLLSLASTVAGATYSWTLNGTEFSTIAQPTVSPNQTTTYNVTAIFEDCTVNEEVTITVAQAFSVSIATVPTSCPGDEVTLIATANPAVPQLSYNWTASTGPNPAPGSSTTSAPTVTTTYTVTVEDPAGCFSETATLTVEVAPAFAITASSSPANPVLAGSEVTLTAESATTGLSYEWTDSEGNVIGTSAVTTTSTCGDQVYTVTATDFNNCEQSLDVPVTVLEGFNVDSVFVIFGDSVVFEIYEGQEIRLITETVPSPVTGASFEWTFNDSIFSTTTDTVSAAFNAPEVVGNTFFNYGVYVTDPTGCLDSLIQGINVLNNPVEVPNVFTPNGDQTNDVFLPVSIVPVTISQFQVWNRWGQLVFDNENNGTGWDGSFKDEPAASDVYVYRIVWEITNGSGTKVVEKGDVTLLR